MNWVDIKGIFFISSKMQLWLLLVCSFLFFNPSTQAQTTFLEKSEAVGIEHYFYNGNMMGGGVAVFDFNNDGWEDIWINGGNRRDVLYQNNADGSFSEVGYLAGLGHTLRDKSTGVCTGDIDNDGYRDVMVTTREGSANILFRNKGDGSFENISSAAGISAYKAWSTAATFADVNQDGYQDIYVVNYVEEFGYISNEEQTLLVGYDHVCQPNYLFINNQDGTFTEMAADYQLDDQGCALATAFTDFDNDADLDLMVVNDYGQWVIPNNLFINRSLEKGKVSFESIEDSSAIKVAAYAMGLAIGDYDQDQDLDYYVTNIGPNALIRNEGQEQFSDASADAGVEDTYAGKDFTVGWGTSFLDVDNDSDLDLFVANGFISALSFNRSNIQNGDKLFINYGVQDTSQGPVFLDESLASGLGDQSTARGLAKADFDRDGDLDLLLVRVSGTTDPRYRKRILYYENQLNNGNNWLKVKLKDKHQGEIYGAHLRIVLGEKSWLTEINGGSSHASQHSSIAHFGLGPSTLVDSLIITMPGGQESIYTQIEANQEIEIEVESKILTSTNIVNSNVGINFTAFPNPIQGFTWFRFDNPKDRSYQLKILDPIGRLVFYQKLNGHQFKWNRQNLTAGVYFALLQDNEGRQTSLKLILK